MGCAVVEIKNLEKGETFRGVFLYVQQAIN